MIEKIKSKAIMTESSFYPTFPKVVRAIRI